jgi:hypothetical protein
MRESKNLPIQSLCADITKIAMGNLFLRLEPLGVKFINTVHDSKFSQFNFLPSEYSPEPTTQASKHYCLQLRLPSDGKI